MTISVASLWKNRRLALALLIGSSVSLVYGEVVEVDVSEWVETGTGETASGWTVNGIDAYKDGSARFNLNEEFAFSPLFSGFVTQAVFRVRSSNTTVTRFLTVTPTIAEPWAEAQRLQPLEKDSFTVQTLVWPLSAQVRQIRLQNEGAGSAAGWGVGRLTLFLDRIAAPSGLRQDPCCRDAFRAGWDPVPDAVRYEVGVDTVVVVPRQGTVLRSWDFSHLTNIVDRTRSLKEMGYDAEELGVGGVTLCLPGLCGGYLQVGMSDVVGVLSLPLPDAGNRTCLANVFRAGADTDGAVSVSWVGNGGVTNSLATLWLGRAEGLARFELPDDAREIVFTSLKSRRVCMVSAEVLSDYVPGVATTNAVSTARSSGCECLVKNLQPGTWLWHVRSFDSRGLDSPWSENEEIVLDASSPPCERSGFCVILK